MFVRLLRNTPRQAARLARQQHNRLVTRGAVVETQQRYQVKRGLKFSDFFLLLKMYESLGLV